MEVTKLVLKILKLVRRMFSIRGKASFEISSLPSSFPLTVDVIAFSSPLQAPEPDVTLQAIFKSKQNLNERRNTFVLTQTNAR